ncbi:MAG: hypothetical protein PHV59_13080 [Victivallales bacterium]|nr:hypothetical protein [Victivallales bacterium]
MKKLIMLSIAAAVVAILSTGCNCSCWSKNECAMCHQKLHSGKCIATCQGKVDCPCASHCFMCPNCKLAVTPERAEKCRYKCRCGEKLVPMKNMSYQDMCKFSQEQAKCMEKCCVCHGDVHRCCCLETKSGKVGNCCIGQCMVCNKCKTIMTPAQAEACDNMCCGEKLTPVKAISEEELDSLRPKAIKSLQKEDSPAGSK